MTLSYVIVSIKLCVDVGNDEYIILLIVLTVSSFVGSKKTHLSGVEINNFIEQ